MPLPTVIACHRYIVLCSAEGKQKQKYVEACLAHHACFNPLCFTIDVIYTWNWVSGISGMEWWNGLLEWNTGIDWDKIFALA